MCCADISEPYARLAEIFHGYGEIFLDTCFASMIKYAAVNRDGHAGVPTPVHKNWNPGTNCGQFIPYTSAIFSDPGTAVGPLVKVLLRMEAA